MTLYPKNILLTNRKIGSISEVIVKGGEYECEDGESKRPSETEGSILLGHHYFTFHLIAIGLSLDGRLGPRSYRR